MESYRQQGRSMFENMRTNHLQVWQKCYHEYTEINAIKKTKISVIIIMLSLSLLFFIKFCTSVTSQWVGPSNVKVAGCWGRVAEGKSCFWPQPRGAAKAKLGAASCWRSQPDQVTHSQKGSKTLQTGIAFEPCLVLWQCVVYSLTGWCCYSRCRGHCVWG